MGIIDFLNPKEKEKFEKIDSDILKEKNKKIQEEILKGKNPRELEMIYFSPKKFHKEKSLNKNKLFGLKQKIVFFVDEKEFKLIKNKWGLIEQINEKRIPSKYLNEFIKKILE